MVSTPHTSDPPELQAKKNIRILKFIFGGVLNPRFPNLADFSPFLKEVSLNFLLVLTKNFEIFLRIFRGIQTEKPIRSHK